MIKIPFKPENFAKEMKPKISGMNLSLEYYNIESSLYKVGISGFSWLIALFLYAKNIVYLCVYETRRFA